LRGHDAVDVFVNHRNFVEAGGDQFHAILF
jgi:hypothetical protein